MDEMTPARRGWALLEAHGPDGWKERLNPGVLDVNSVFHCPLAQVYGGYTHGARTLFLAAGLISGEEDRIGDLAVSHGFESRTMSYDELTEEWRGLIAQDHSEGQR